MYPFLRPITYFGDLVPGFFIKDGAGDCEVSEGTEYTSDLLRANSNYGQGVKQLGNELFVGEPGAVGSIFSVGEVHYYTRASVGADWVRQSGFFSPTQSNGSAFGSDISYDGTRVIVAEPNVSKAANVFTFSGGVATIEQEITANTYTDAASRFSRGVAINGSHALIGAPGQDLTFADQGGVEYWTESGGTWTFQQAFTAGADLAAQINFGAGICMLDDSTAYISRNNGSAIQVERWTRSGSTWSYDALGTFSLVGYGSGGFTSMDSDGVNLILGFPAWDDGGSSTNNYGIAIVLSPTGNILSVVEGTTLGNQLGGGVSIDGSQAMIGEPFADPSSVSAAGIATTYGICT